MANNVVRPTITGLIYSAIHWDTDATVIPSMDTNVQGSFPSRMSISWRSLRCVCRWEIIVQGFALDELLYYIVDDYADA